MKHCTFEIGTSFCLTLSLARFEPLRYVDLRHGLASDRWVAKFCAARPGACTRDAADYDYFLERMDRQIQRYRTACGKGCPPMATAALEVMFPAIFNLVERCLDLTEEDCVCPMEWRLHRAEALGSILIEIAWALWAMDVDIAPIAKALEELACAATEVQERQAALCGPLPPFAIDCASLAARADRLAMKLFDAVNDLHCANWRELGW